LAWVAFSQAQNYADNPRSQYSGKRHRVQPLDEDAPVVGGRRVPLWPFEVVTLSSLAVILIAYAVRSSQLKSGGGAQVAQYAGGEAADPGDPLEKRLINVVEEMSLASGTPQPRVYVMRSEGGINAFAAGWSPEDAAICVTRGCLLALSRDELQGVVAHEFSHIFNADMRINIRAMGMLFGLYSLAIVGREILYWGRGADDEDGKVGKMIMILGFGFLVLGWLGEMLGHVLAAAISRQREYLADASAVQFTRNPDGIGGALRKIAGASESGSVGSRIEAPKALAMSHMFFGAGSMSLSGGMLATHPPLEDRIEKVYGRPMGALAPIQAASEFAGPAAQSPAPAASGFAGSSMQKATLAALAVAASAQIMESSQQALPLGGGALPPVPERLRQACSEPEMAEGVCLALVCASQDSPDMRAKALELAVAAAGPRAAAALPLMVQDMMVVEASMHVPLIDLCAGSLKGLEEARKPALLKTMTAIAKLDGKVSLREQALFQVAKRRMARVGPASGKSQLADCALQAGLAVAWVARRAQADAKLAQAAFGAAAKSLPAGAAEAWSGGKSGETAPDWAKLDAMAPMQKPALAKAIGVAAGSGELGRDAARIACALLGCPAPFAEAAW
jgi:Zn-dependent protease with chaperone function/uncharacterized membrane protein YebE (DUF533 family)